VNSRQLNIIYMMISSRMFIAVILIATILQTVNSLWSPFIHHYSIKQYRYRSPISMQAKVDITPILDQGSFDAITINNSENIPVIVDFQKSNCRPCQKVAPLFIKLAEKYVDKARFYKVDADSSKECLMILKANSIKAVPTFQVWVGGKQVEIIQGAKLEELDEAITDAIVTSISSKT
jgi:thioredoxin 1